MIEIKNKNDSYLVRGLTDLEIKIVNMLSEGNTVNDIAKQANMTPSNLKSMMYVIYQKIGVKTLAQLIVFDLNLDKFFEKQNF